MQSSAHDQGVARARPCPGSPRPADLCCRSPCAPRPSGAAMPQHSAATRGSDHVLSWSWANGQAEPQADGTTAAWIKHGEHEVLQSRSEHRLPRPYHSGSELLSRASTARRYRPGDRVQPREETDHPEDPADTVLVRLYGRTQCPIPPGRCGGAPRPGIRSHRRSATGLNAQTRRRLPQGRQRRAALFGGGAVSAARSGIACAGCCHPRDGTVPHAGRPRPSLWSASLLYGTSRTGSTATGRRVRRSRCRAVQPRASGRALGIAPLWGMRHRPRQHLVPLVP
ncbi:hypothetical protein FHS40_006357 [Streptomyces spectabilis]|uniref:Uncharacterized protein n=1 Tax=Streptomyces spectabilis TaxID=68270 RepID=A0A7W8B144_STRST|nr:hypothetical protein [Streptomyces spectabilis]